MKISKAVKGIVDDHSAATAVEYGLIVAMIVIAIVTSLKSVADESTGLWATVSDAVTSVMGV